MLEQARLLAGQHRPPQRTCSCRAERNPSIRPRAPTSRSLWSEPLAAATRASQTPVAQESRNLNLAGADPAPSDDAFRSLVDIVWDGSEVDALLATSPLSREHPLWRLLLLSDGSVTRHLQLLTGSAVTVDCLSMEPVSTGDNGLPRAVAELEHPLLQREVLLRNMDDSGRALVHATSWWNVAAASSNLRDPSKPIWVSLSQARKELYREIKVVRLGHSDQLAAHFGAPGPFWGRQYLFWSGGAPLTLIHEVFSPALADYLQ